MIRLLTAGAAALLLSVSLSGQTPTPSQGRDYVTPAYRVIAVDTQGRIIISNPGGGTSCTLMAPCYVVGVDADGVVSTTNPVQVGGKDPATGTVRELRMNTQGQFTIGPTVSGSVIDAAANPLVSGIASSGGRARFLFAPDAVLDTNNGQNSASVVPSLFNGTTYDRQRSAAGSIDNASGTGSNRASPILLNNSGNYDREFVCDKQAKITFTAATDAVIVAAGGGATRTKICHIDWSMDTGQVATIREGTGSTCGSSTNDLTGGYQAALTFAQDYSNKAALRNQSNNVDTCVHFASAVTGGGVVIYAQF
jgi:hypothetical protein